MDGNSTPRSVSAIQRAIKEEKTASDPTLSARVKGRRSLVSHRVSRRWLIPIAVASLKMKITPDVFEAYLKCPTKCWLRATNEPSAGNTYPEWEKARNDSYRVSETRRLVAEFQNNEVALSPDMKNLKAAKWRLASSLAMQAQKIAPESAISRSAKELFILELGTYRFRQRGVLSDCFHFQATVRFHTLNLARGSTSEG
jgi:hypothetical protein